MKLRSSLFVLFALTLILHSCKKDNSPDTPPQKDWRETIALTIAPSEAINLQDITTTSIQFVTPSISDLPAQGTLSPLVLNVSATGSSEQFALENTNGEVLVTDLQEVVEKCYDKSFVARELRVVAAQTASADNKTADMTSDTVSVMVTPLEQITPAYCYIVGGVQGWDISNKSVKMMPIAAEQGGYTLTTDFSRGGGNDPNFKIAMDTNEGLWDELYGAFVDGSTDLAGELVNVYAGAIMCPTKEIYTIDIDIYAMKYTLTLAADQAPSTYNSIGIIGAFSDWGNAMADAAMEEVAPHLWAYDGFVHPAAGELKLRANNEGSTTWGIAATVDQTINTTLEIGGSNLNMPAGTFNLYFNDITMQLYIISVTQ